MWGIHRSPVNSPHKGQWHGDFTFSLICAWIKVAQTVVWLLIWDAILTALQWYHKNADHFAWLCFVVVIWVMDVIVHPCPSFNAWWRHQMETFSALLAFCAGNSPVPGEFPAQSPVTRSFEVFFDLRPNKRLNKQSWGWWFETPSRPLWRHSNDFAWLCFVVVIWMMDSWDLFTYGHVLLWLYGWWINGTSSPMVFNSLVTGKCSWNPRLVFLNVYQHGGLEHFLCNYPQVNALRLYLWQVNINSNNGLVLSGNKPLTEPVLTKTPLARPLWVQVVSLNDYPSAIYVTLRDIGKFDPY